MEDLYFLVVVRPAIAGEIEKRYFALNANKNKKRGSGMLKEFREFAMRGNVVDMAVGIIIGAAFGTIVRSLVSDILMPPYRPSGGKC